MMSFCALEENWLYSFTIKMCGGWEFLGQYFLTGLSIDSFESSVNAGNPLPNKVHVLGVTDSLKPTHEQQCKDPWSSGWSSSQLAYRFHCMFAHEAFTGHWKAVFHLSHQSPKVGLCDCHMWQIEIPWLRQQESQSGHSAQDLDTVILSQNCAISASKMQQPKQAVKLLLILRRPSQWWLRHCIISKA